MYIRTLILFSILRLIYSDSDEEDYERWNPRGALIQTQLYWPAEKQFPTTVRISDSLRKKVYFSQDEAQTLITFGMCPIPDTRHRLGRYCNYGKSYTLKKYMYSDEPLVEICPITVEPAMEKVMTGLIVKTHADCVDGGNRYRFVYYNEDYVQRMILPPEFLPFALMRKPLYHYMNLAPMDKDLLPAWELLMKNLKNRIARMNQPLNVTAGVLGILNNKYLGNVFIPPIHQNEEGTLVPEIPIPHTWWILLYDYNRKKGVVIMMTNEPFNRRMQDVYYDSRNCSMGICTGANVRSALPPDNYYAHIYCCHPYAVTLKYKLSGRNDLLVLPDYINLNQ